jgi:glutathione peroxidase
MLRIALASLLLVVAGWAGAEDKKVTKALDFKMKDIDGKEVDLAKKYDGKVVLLVNVASKCGLTPQYKELEKLHEKYADQGLRIIGVPANNFGKQEPGTESEIKEFCSSKYGVKFDMMSKVSVKGDDICAMYKFLTSKDTNPKFAGEITWNFEKFLINKKGEVVNRFTPRTTPDDKKVVEAIEAELAK